MVLVGVLGILADQPWLFPSLGPTAFLQAEIPDHRMARFANIIVGHLVGLGAGYLAVALLQAEDASSVLFTGHLTAVRIWASALAIALTILGGILLRVSHPPASATTLLIALGGFRPTVHDATTVCVGVAIVASVGELLRRIRLGQVIAHWGDMRSSRM
jgi:CBS-domain-containing membrane protein